MPNYKDQSNNVHFIDSAAFEHLLPAGCVKITEEEAEALRPKPPPPVFTCSPWQMRKALNMLDLRAAVEAAIAASTDITLKDGWEFATEFRSDDPFIISMGAALGKSEAETAELIQLAAGL